MTTAEIMFAIKVIAAWHSWLGFGYGKDVSVGAEGLINGQKRGFPLTRSLRDLYRSGEKVYGKDFKFREGQSDCAMEIYSSETHLFPIQALPEYGKTALIQLPLVAVAQQHSYVISFVFVPYVALETNMRLRLSTGGLTCGAVKSLFANGPAVAEGDFRCNVYVGTFNDLASDNFITMMNNWYTLYQNILLGMVVIDEFHNLVTEQSYRGSTFKSIPDINFSLSWKLICMTGTAGKNLMKEGLRFIGVGDSLTTNITGSGVFYYNYVTSVPLVNVVKTFDYFDDHDAIVQKVKYVVTKFLTYADDTKVIIVCREKSTVELLGAVTFCDSIWVHGDLPTEVKVKKTQDFIQDSSKRILIGTKLVSEGIDIPEVKMVLIVDYLPSVGEYIQTAGRLRQGGLCYTYWTRRSVCEDDKQQVDPQKCITDQVSKFYGLDNIGHQLCCGNDVNITQELKNMADYTLNVEMTTNEENDGGIETIEVEPTMANTIEPANIELTINTLHPQVPRGGELQLAPKRRRMNTTKDILQSLFGNCTNVFDFSGLPQEAIKYLHFYGVGESYFDSPLKSAAQTCYKCLGEKVEGCVCWKDSQISIRKVGLEVLLLYKSVLPGGSFDGVKRNILDGGLHRVLIQFATNKVSMKKLVEAKLSKFYTAMIGFRRLHYPERVFKHDGQMTSTYNIMWETLLNRKLDIISFFSTKRSTLTLPELWSIVSESSFDERIVALRRVGSSRYGRYAFVVQHGGRIDYLLDAIGFDYLDFIVGYDQNKDFNSRKEYIGRNLPKKAPSVRADRRLYSRAQKYQKENGA
ncbi:uncharacterized protein NDAI_0A00850 [Naumovozyma dairenensis CBS 421]|uniref:DNA 3'-5' helicase n=1 Tax=Naumovozyma dairenensis (strain ATCC 10597 / BCRC 20456 / CBS 421 / NBRC 0211 / NRRL Y-12639) TaxID=1071378 RepID=G0W355_NAUDC|nr:hypothetical protein NDAI_0A00850 [Naumovozyma dairenensis CBS 421]CCD22243.1 hypothetical protein NDAI_0A00850 [Naumovozyma dairenensis CBS 421]